MSRGDHRRKLTLAEYGFRLPSCIDNRPLRFEEWEAMRPQTVFVSATPGKWEMEATGGVFVEQVIRPTGLIDPPIEDQARRGPGRGLHFGGTQGRRQRLPHARHDADQTHGRGPDRVHARGGAARSLHAQRRRDLGAHRAHPRPSPRRLRRAGWHQPIARRPRYPRMRPRRDHGRRQGGLSALGDEPDPDDRPRRAQRRGPRHPLRRPDHRQHGTRDGRNRPPPVEAGGV